MTARMDQLQHRMDSLDLSSVTREALVAADMIEEGIISGNVTLTANGLTSLRRALNPAVIWEKTFYDYVEATEVVRRLNDTENKWATANAQTMGIKTVLELILIVQRIMFRYIPTAKDRAECAREIRSYLPAGTDQPAPADAR